jgi:putative PIN family toxin of toxin-antitoxin system
LDRKTLTGIERLLRENGVILEPAAVADDACRDSDDLHVLGLVKTGQAEYLITGDEDFLVLI